MLSHSCDFSLDLFALSLGVICRLCSVIVALPLGVTGRL